MRLLFITQKIHEGDDDLAFAILWVQAFQRAGFDVSVICLEKRDFDNSFPVYSLGKELGVGRVRRIFRFLRLIMTLRYDRVFVHMNPQYFTLGGWWWFVRGIPSYLWYTHYTMTIHLFIAGMIARRLFAATPQSLPQFAKSPKRIIPGHGIDVAFWSEVRNSGDEYAIISVHRLSRSKRLDRTLKTLALLPERYTLMVYGRALDPEHYTELLGLVDTLGLKGRVTFKGPVPMHSLKAVYPQHRLMLNLATETIDKTMLEGMLYGVYPVTTPQNGAAIGLTIRPESDEPEELARFIVSGAWKGVSEAELRNRVITHHSLDALMAKMSSYILPGT